MGYSNCVVRHPISGPISSSPSVINQSSARKPQECSAKERSGLGTSLLDPTVGTWMHLLQGLTFEINSF